MIKKIISIMLVAVLLSACISASIAESQPYHTLLTRLLYSQVGFDKPSDSLKSALDRAYMTVLLVLDYVHVTQKSINEFDLTETYIGSYGEYGIDLFVANENGGYTNIVWYPSDDDMYVYSFYYTKSELKSKYPNLTKNSASDILEALDQLQNLLESLR